MKNKRTLYIMRHGKAEPYCAADAERKLVCAGVEEVEHACTQLIRRDVKLDLLLASPYVRARETAQVVYENLHPDRELIVSDLLTPDTSPDNVVELLDSLDWSAAMVVSHQPLVSLLLAWLLSGEKKAERGMSTASVACVQFSIFGVGLGDLKWIL